MNAIDLEQSFQEWLSIALRDIDPDVTPRLSVELNQHFNELISVYTHKGKAEFEAHSLALEEMGDARDINEKFKTIYLTQKEIESLSWYTYRKTSTRQKIIIFLKMQIPPCLFWFIINFIPYPHSDRIPLEINTNPAFFMNVIFTLLYLGIPTLYFDKYKSYFIEIFLYLAQGVLVLSLIHLILPITPLSFLTVFFTTLSIVLVVGAIAYQEEHKKAKKMWRMAWGLKSRGW